ncbi:TPM domain-containing protein [Granulicella sp. 5B5]|uniref:TPM domain-containing protein n=1 Tax=Granulicella sp. 5B5 TaxID=1617967 RepID=UPI00175960A2|nr:TPM domain-containing protein [Granulicella sp. 5B5]QMV17841.1 TPM domain-containing protein [Granulicella sp. 5B5]
MSRLRGLGGPGCVHAQSSSSQDLVATLPAPTDYVSDLANVIDPTSKQQIDELCSELDHQAHAQIAVVTIDSLNGQPIEEFATELEDKWKVGPKASDRGLLMIFAIKDRQRRIEVGYGLEGVLNDAKVGDIGRSMVPLLRQAQYGPAILGGLQQIATDIATDAGVTLTPVQQTYHYQQQDAGGVRLGSILRIIIFVVILIVIFSGRGRGGGGWLWFLLGSMMGGGGGGGRGGDGWGGGGGDGGGGGFGGFGGGSSGGGGASGSW